MLIVEMYTISVFVADRQLVQQRGKLRSIFDEVTVEVYKTEERLHITNGLWNWPRREHPQFRGVR